MAGLGPTLGQHPTDSGMKSTDAQNQVLELQFRLIELQETLHGQKIGLGEIKTLFERIMSQLDNYSPENQIIHLERMIKLLEKRISHHSETVSKMQESTGISQNSSANAPGFRANSAPLPGSLPSAAFGENDHEGAGSVGSAPSDSQESLHNSRQNVNYAGFSNQNQQYRCQYVARKRRSAGSALRHRDACDGGDDGETLERQNLLNDRRKRKLSSEESESIGDGGDQSQATTRGIHPQRLRLLQQFVHFSVHLLHDHFQQAANGLSRAKDPHSTRRSYSAPSKEDLISRYNHHNATLEPRKQTEVAGDFIFRNAYITREKLLIAGRKEDPLAASQEAVESIGASRVTYTTMSLRKCATLDTEYKPFLSFCLELCSDYRKLKRQGETPRITTEIITEKWKESAQFNPKISINTMASYGIFTIGKIYAELDNDSGGDDDPGNSAGGDEGGGAAAGGDPSSSGGRGCGAAGDPPAGGDCRASGGGGTPAGGGSRAAGGVGTPEPGAPTAATLSATASATVSGGGGGGANAAMEGGRTAAAASGVHCGDGGREGGGATAGGDPPAGGGCGAAGGGGTPAGAAGGVGTPGGGGCGAAAGGGGSPAGGGGGAAASGDPPTAAGC